jgi:hypothetical protein
MNPTFTPPPAPPPSPKRVLPFLLLVAAGAAVGVGVGAVLERSVKREELGVAAAPFALARILFAWFVSVAVHEAGHLLFAMRSGMKPLLYIVGPLRVSWEGGRTRIGFNGNLATWGGLAAAIPPTIERLRERMRWLVAGGPLASLTLAAACGLLSLLDPPRAIPVALLGVMSLGIFLITSVPLAAGGFQSDGAQLLSLHRGGPDVERRMLLVLLSGSSMSGQRPRELDPELLASALRLEGNALGRAAAVLLACTVAVDRGEPAEDWFAELGSLYFAYPDAFRQSIALWMAWYVAAEHRDPALAKEWLQRGRGGIVDPALRDLAEAAIMDATGDRESACVIAARGRSRASGMDPGTGRLIRDLLERYRHRVSRSAPLAPV